MGGIQMAEPALVHVVAGGVNQLPLVWAARDLGHRVLVTDMFPNPPCRAESDLFVQMDVVDRAGTLEVARQYGVNGVVTDQTDVAVPTVALIAEELGLPGIGFETALRFTNKELMRLSLAGSRDVRLPTCTFFEEMAPALEFATTEASPTGQWLVKPVNSQGSRGVARLGKGADESLLLRAFDASRQKGVLIEEYIDGDEYSVEAFIVDGRRHNLAVTRKYHYAENDCIDERNTYLGDVPSDIEEALFRANDEIASTMNPGFCSMHTEFKIQNGNVYLIETAARGGGGNISGKLLPYLTGFEPCRALVQAAMGETVEPRFDDYRTRFAAMRFFNFDQGVLSSIDFDREMADGLLHFELDVGPGSEIRSILDSRNRPGYFIVSGDDADAVEASEQAFLDTFELAYEPR